MKLLLKKIAQNRLAILIRNFLGIKPVILNSLNIKENYSISDAFLWRTDNNFKTIFKYSNLLDLFYKENDSYVEIFFYDKQYHLLKKIKINDLKILNKLTIDKSFFNGIEDYGIFYIFHKTSNIINSSIRNSCYLGFSYGNNLESFVHGNLPTTYQDFQGKNNGHDIIGISPLKNQKYRIQKYFNKLSKSEIFINNPSLKTIKFSINNHNFVLEGGCSKMVDISIYNEVEILSNCYLLRPIVFNYKGDFIDVHHG